MPWCYSLLVGKSKRRLDFLFQRTKALVDEIIERKTFLLTNTQSGRQKAVKTAHARGFLSGAHNPDFIYASCEGCPIYTHCTGPYK